jgi:hypothetical protein
MKMLLQMVMIGLFCAPVMSHARELLWGDTHVHTSNSFDAFPRGNQSADVDTAYRYAKGLPVVHPYHRARIRIQEKLDFLVIADHAEFLGVMRTVYNSGIPEHGLNSDELKQKDSMEKLIRESIDSNTFYRVMMRIAKLYDGDPVNSAKTTELYQEAIPNSRLMARTAWEEAADLADKHNVPGKFTAMIGWEWSPIPGGANLHRVVFTDADAQTAKTFRPFDTGDSAYPQDLWNWLEDVSQSTNAEFIAIPHNSNISKGYMFPVTTIKDVPVDAEYARLRAKWEPVAEVTQIKGDSETISSLSPNDEFADFETYAYHIQAKNEGYNALQGDYLRSGLRRGLKLEQALGTNPYKLGMIGSTDAHTGMASAEEQNFHGKMARDGTPERKLINPDRPDATSGWAMAAQGLAAVWADYNDRTSIMQAFKRREVYATSGPRIYLRVFGGWDFNKRDLNHKSYPTNGYTKGVPMGGDLPERKGTNPPSFLIHAGSDSKGANLDRVQVIKGWVDSQGQSFEKVYDVAWAGEDRLGVGKKLAAIGNTVNLETATYTNSIGAPLLSTVWRDPDFKPELSAFYYVRVIEIPTPRHALADALALGMVKPDRGPAVIQERAYSSPIWYAP